MSRRLNRGVGAAAVAAAALLAGPSASFAATAGATGNMSDVQVVGRAVQFVFDGGDSGPVDPNSVVVTVEGQEIPATAVPITEGTTASKVTRSAMLVVDTSGSMLQNGRIDGARQAARAFISAAPADLAIGVVTFDNRAKLVQSQTTDHAKVIKAVDGLAANPNGSTAIYDGVVTAVQQLGAAGTRSIVLLTDGVPQGGNATSAQAVAAIQDSKIRVDAVAFQTAAGKAPLKRLTDAGKGKVVSSASAAQLTAQFQAAAARLSSQLLVNGTVPEDGPSGQVTLTVNGDAGGTPVSDSAIALIASESSPSPTQSVDASPVPVTIRSGPLMSNELILVAAGLL